MVGWSVNMIQEKDGSKRAGRSLTAATCQHMNDSSSQHHMGLSSNLSTHEWQLITASHGSHVHWFTATLPKLTTLWLKLSTYKSVLFVSFLAVCLLDGDIKMFHDTHCLWAHFRRKSTVAEQSVDNDISNLYSPGNKMLMLYRCHTMHRSWDWTR